MSKMTAVGENSIEYSLKSRCFMLDGLPGKGYSMMH